MRLISDSLIGVKQLFQNAELKFWLTACLVTGLFLYFYQSTVRAYLEFWLNNATYSHGFLVLLICLYCVITRIRSAPLMTIRPMLASLPLLIISQLAWMATHIASVQLLESILLPLVLYGYILTVFGFNIGKIVLFPIIFFYFAVPIWDHFNPYLQILTVKVVSLLLASADIPVHITGNDVTLPTGRFTIAAGCSGLKYLLVGIALTTLYSQLQFQRVRNRLLLVVAGIAITLLANWVRVFVIIYIGFKTQMQHALVEEHNDLGWLIFAVAIIPIYFIAIRLTKNDKIAAARRQQPGTASVKAPSKLNNQKKAALLLLLLWPPLAYNAAAAFYVTSSSKSGYADHIEGWSGPAPIMAKINSDWSPDFNNTTANMDVRYNHLSNTAYSVHLHTRYYQHQLQGHELISDDNTLEPVGWFVSVSSKVKLGSDDHARNVQELILESDVGRSQLVWFWYEIGDFKTANKMQAKLLQIPAFILGADDAMLVAIVSNCHGSCDQARHAVEQFHNELTIKH